MFYGENSNCLFLDVQTDQIIRVTMKILLTFIGNNDCYIDEKPGAILSILKEIEFDKLYILYNSEKYLKPASDILRYCRKNHPQLEVFYQEALTENPI